MTKKDRSGTKRWQYLPSADKKYLKRWRRQDRKVRGDMTLMDWIRIYWPKRRKRDV